MNYLVLQNKIKKDPTSYRAEFLQQRRHFQAELEIFLLRPNREYKNFAALVSFLSQVASCYPQDLQQFPTQIANLLEQHGSGLDHELRKSLVNAIIVLRKRNVIGAPSVFTLFFKLFEIKDKTLRRILYNHIISDIGRLNAKKGGPSVNRALQNFLQAILLDHVKIMSLMALEVLMELFKRGVWRDSKTVAIICLAIFNSNPKILNRVLDFFVRPVVDGEGDLDATEQEKSYSKIKSKIQKKLGPRSISKVNRRKKKFKQAMSELKNIRKSQLEDRVEDRKNYNFSAILLIEDPQGYAEKVYRVLIKSTNTFETKIKIMNFLSRLISVHQLLILDYYSYMIKYLRPSQERVTVLLAIVVQACHPLVPPDVVEPLIKVILNNFISDSRPPEVVVVGLNTVREISIRTPHALCQALLVDLLQYIKSKSPGVSVAAKSLLSLYRVLSPSLLPKKFRASKIDDKDNSCHPILEYGQTLVKTQIDGIDLLEQFKSGNCQDLDLSSCDDDDQDDDDDCVQWESFEETETSDIDHEFESCSSSCDDSDQSTRSSLASWMLSDDSSNGNEPNDEHPNPSNYGADHILNEQEWELIKKLKRAKEQGKLNSFIKSEKKKDCIYDEIAAKLEQIQCNDVQLESLDLSKVDRKTKAEETKKLKKQLEKEKIMSRSHRIASKKTNKKLKKRKPFMMVKHSRQVREKEKLPLFLKTQRKQSTVANMKRMPKSIKSKILKVKGG